MKIGISQRVAPIRLCFLIQPDSEASFLEAVETAFSTWGGIYAPILPFYEDLPKEFRREFSIDIATEHFYKNSFENYDVDVIIHDNQLNAEVIKRLDKGREIISIEQFKKGKGSWNNGYGIELAKVAVHVAQTEFKFARNDNAEFCMPVVTSGDLFLKAWRGVLTSEANKQLTEIFSACNVLSTVDIDWGSVGKYIESIESGHIDPRSLCSYQIGLWRNQRIPQRTLLYCFNHKRLRDIINFWNLRAAGNIVIPISDDGQEMTASLNLFTKFYEQEVAAREGHGIFMVNCLIGYESSKDKISGFHKDYHHNNPTAKGWPIAFQNWFPRFWGSHEITMADGIKSATPYCSYQLDYYEEKEGGVEFRAHSLPFVIDEDIWEDRSFYKIMMELLFFDEYAEYAGLLSDLSPRQLKKLLHSYSSMGAWRLSAGTLQKVVLAQSTFPKISFAPPRALEFFNIYFENKGYRLRETVNSKLAKEVFKNLEGLNGVLFFLQNEQLKIIELFEEKREVTYGALMGAIKRGLKNTKYGNQFILKLLENKIIEFGAKVRCTVCEQAGFFLPGEVLPDMNCPICRNSFKLPMARPDLIEWAYRGIGPFARNNKADGVMSVFATLRLFLEHIADDKKITSLFGFELIKPGQTDPKEIDLCLLSGDRHDNFKQSELIMCECKTYVHLKDVDIERMKMLGDEFPGAILTIATLNEHLTADEVRLLTGLVQHFQTGEGDRPRNPVLILTGTELLNPDISFPLGKYEDQMQGFQRHNDFIGALCELTVKKHLAIRNWGEIKMDRWNEEIYRRQTIGNIVDAVLKLKSADARVSE